MHLMHLPHQKLWMPLWFHLMKQHLHQPLQPFRGCLIRPVECLTRCWSSFSQSEACCPIISYWTTVVGIICPKKEPPEIARSPFVQTYPKKHTAAQMTHCINEPSRAPKSFESDLIKFSGKVWASRTATFRGQEDAPRHTKEVTSKKGHFLRF